RLGIRVEIKINNRKLLAAIANRIGRPERLTDITVAIDKLEKIGIENVQRELIDKGLTQNDFEVIRPIIELQGENRQKLETLSKLFGKDADGQKGIQELTEVLNYLESSNLRNLLTIDLSLARGLNYYTGCIFEVKARDVAIGSICGGGRYENLTGVFGMPGLSGVGISFGADRIYDVLDQLNAFPEMLALRVRAMFVNFGNIAAFEAANRLRQLGVSVEVYPENAKLKKQLNYANAKNIPFVVFIGEEELANKTFNVKDMTIGEQQTVDFEQLFNIVSKK
ncbi:MAG TPA: ATP phosphoribosyltransferase regulatory subunit, partial [Salinivirgaceae bacterium]|nr:ATP phosphoribosyltransferase regulatory subunit [Salinivirgaceae bacterium]